MEQSSQHCSQIVLKIKCVCFCCLLHYVFMAFCHDYYKSFFKALHYSILSNCSQRFLFSCVFDIHKAPFSHLGTSLVGQLSHLNVFNLRRILNQSNDMQNLIFFVHLPLVSSLSSAGFASGKEKHIHIRKRIGWGEKEETYSNVISTL